MHTQTENTQIHRNRRANQLGTASGLALYLLTLIGEVVLGASVRWLLIYLGAVSVGAFVPLGPSAEGLAWIAAAAPLAYSALGLALPGRGRLWRRRLGARRPIGEEAAALADALELLRSADPRLPSPDSWFVLDDPYPSAAVRGRALILSRGLLDSDALAAVLAHELGHTESLDGRLTEALGRMVLWEDPLGPPPREGRDAYEPDESYGLLFGAIRWALRLAGGSVAQQLLGSLWVAHWRAREFAADAYAASLGQAEDLARYLTERELPFDPPQPHIFFNQALHPPVAQRVERLLASFEAEGSE